ncbi:pilus assembly protein [Shewanella aestuarii]|uniref:rRNA (Guanine-N1)-methyltransferase n=1 Tax=Shewanella aestuarii TaxID=1028752 RepID=A0A6G9QMB8_9GAMM|nr:PilC/PilY family type IV pilus protein [Shewanella aestuarii]QIR15197.1 rRNA (guanine-N1)-methyltransferase [Shewanella aestuarii]
MNIRKLACTFLAATLVMSSLSFADDTELYVYESTVRTGARPQVLIIFDNSGSMKTIEEDAVKGYNPDQVYPAVGNENALQERMVYFTKGGIDNSALPVPDSPSESRRFLAEINGCESSWEYLDKYGIFTGFFREYTFSGQNGTWSEVPDNNGANIEILDCFEDIDAIKFKNADGQPLGLPVDSQGNKQNPVRYSEVNESSSPSEIENAIKAAKLTAFGTGQPLTLYTDNYLRWFNGDQELVPKSRLEIAKEVITNTIVTTPSVDFGMAVFNINFRNEGDADGGRIVSGIKTMTDASKISLLDTIADLDSETNTPLCETLYEAYSYFAGKSVTFGDKDKKPSDYSYTPNTPPRDRSIENSGVYVSPFNKCQSRAYVVYITDGAPTLDQNADSLIKALPGVKQTGFVNENPNFTNFLPNLAGWMNTNDVNPNLADNQHVTTYTIGFSDGADDAAALLLETAKQGGGEYYAAKNASALQVALQKVFSDILKVNASFTAPSIASNNFDRTETFDSAYYGMFFPNKGPRWTGNLKKFKITSDGSIVDKKGVNAIASDGGLKSSACSYWTPDSVCNSATDGGDGNDVSLGGVAYNLAQQAQRKLYMNFGDTLKDFTKQNAASYAGGEDDLADYMAVAVDELSNTFDWAAGKDVDDDIPNSSVRTDIFGDPLHSKPLAINLGTAGSPDIRVIVGTNHGFLHMFKDSGDSVSESWAFMPYELLPNVKELRDNFPTGVHSVYGMDSSPVAYIKTGETGIEKAWVFVGMRRGGKSYYAIDVTSPDAPKFMWKVDANSDGLSELGQTWSEPVVGLIPGWPAGNTNPENAKPVIIVGAGYAPSTKDGSAVGVDDTNARGVFILDAETGKLVRSFTPTSGTNNTILTGIVDSVPNKVAVLDSNSDGLIDRIYATDTGANVWRIDLPSASPTSSDGFWSAFKFAELGGDAIESDRRFFAGATVAQTVFTNVTEITVTDPAGGSSTTTKSYQNVPYDAVVIGSGHRPHPSDRIRNDKFYTLQDRNVITKSFGGASSNKIPDPITLNQLYDVTSAAPTTDAEQLNFGQKLGWYYSLPSVGEKSLSAASIVRGKVYFTSYVPADTTVTDQCLAEGQGNLYVFDLHKGGLFKTWKTGTFIPPEIPPVIPPKPPKDPDDPDEPEQPTDDGKIYLIVGCGESDGVDCKGTIEAGKTLGVNKIYYHIEE